MAKAQTFGKQAPGSDGTSTSLRDYTSLLGVVAAGILGMSLLCITSAIALSNPNLTPIVFEPASIVDLAVNNINTVSALTVQAVIDIEATPTLFFTATSSPTSSLTVPAGFPSATRIQPTRTQQSRPGPTSTPRPTKTSVPPTKTPKPPTNTPKPPTNTPKPPTNTPKPPTNTPIPPDTNTPVPPDTNTPVPPDTNTPVPPDTNTPVPPDTNTPVPPDTNTPVPPDTDTPGP